MILKKKIEQLLNGKFEYEQPQLLFSKETIALTLKAGETKRGEVYVGTEDNQKIRGYVTSSSRRLVPGMDHISGTTVRLPFGIDTVGLAPGDSLKGWLCFTTNVGEARLPFEIEIEKEEIRSFSGVVEELDRFVSIAKDDFKEAFRIFKRASFARILEKEDKKIQTLYQGLSRQPVTYQHLEEFLIAAGKKEKVTISAREVGKEYYELSDSVKESFYIQRSGWGHLRLDVEAVGDFLEVPRKVVTDEDFIGSHYEVEYLVHKEKLGKGNQFGKIVIKSPYQELDYTIVASTSGKLDVDIHIAQEKSKLELLRDCLAYLCYETAVASCLPGRDNPAANGWMDFSTWCASSHYTLNQLHQTGCDYPEHQMYEAFLLYMENHHEDARKLLESYQDKSYTRDDLEFAGIYLYLCTLTGLYKDKVHALSRIRNFYMQKSDSFVLLWILLKLDPAYKETPSKALFVLEEQFDKGCRSPFLYLEAWKIICKDMTFLHRLNSFWGQVFRFAARRNLLTGELVMRLAYLSGYEKDYNESIYYAMTKGYDQYASDDTLEAICKYVMKGNPRKTEYFPWFSLAVEHGLRLTRLYEYYVETMDTSRRIELPKALLMYFTYNSDSLGDSKRAFIYSCIIANKEKEPAAYERYVQSMREFAKKKLSEGKMNESYAVLYQEFLMEPRTKEAADSIAQKMFTHRLYFDDKKVRYVIVRHSQMEQEELYTCVQGVAYPRIYTEDAAILFQDEKQRRYSATVDYSLKKTMDEEKAVRKVLSLGAAEPGILLHYCESHELDKDNLDIFQRLVKSVAFGAEYKQKVRRRILDYYAAHVYGEDLDQYLKQMDYREYARVDREKLLVVLISRGLFSQAQSIVEEFGYEGVDMRSLLKLVSRMIVRCDMLEDEELLALASDVYRNGFYDEVILTYLMKYRFGPVDEMFAIWKSAVGFELDTYDLEEKILQLLMFTADYRKEGEHVLESYIRHSGREWIVSGYLTHVSYGIFVKEYTMSPFVKNCLINAYMQKWPVDQVCHLALFKELSREKSRKEAFLSIEKDLLKLCMEKGMVFSFFHRLPPEILSLYQMDDKTCVEYHTSPDSKVTLVYALDTGLGRALEYKTEPLKNVYEGIFTRPFTMFYGETLHYYFLEECDGQSKKTPERVLSMSKAEGTPFSKYQMLNQILSARKLDKHGEVKKGLKQYLRQEQYVKEMFVITEED